MSRRKRQQQAQQRRAFIAQPDTTRARVMREDRARISSATPLMWCVTDTTPHTLRDLGLLPVLKTPPREPPYQPPPVIRTHRQRPAREAP